MSSSNSLPCKVPVTVTVVAPASSLISAGLTSSEIKPLAVSSSVIRIPVSYSEPPTLAITVKARGSFVSLSLATVTVIVVVPLVSPFRMVSGCTLTS